MTKVSIKPQWTISDSAGEPLSTRVLELLAQVHDHGSLSGACRHHGASYRHAWNLVRQAEQQLATPLLRMERGKGSTLTPLGEKLVWARHRIAARLTPLLESLASELEVEIDHALATHRDLLRIHASHGFAVEKLFEALTAAGVALDRKYLGSLEAVASLHDGACDIAGFHLPEGELEARAYAHYTRWLDARDSRIVHLATRRQGLMVAAGNPLKIYSVADLARPGVRFINRQRGSGTRLLLDFLFDDAGVDRTRIAGYEQAEYTHAAVASYIASGMADAGFGVETPARRFRLDFIPVASERYFLLCHAAALDKPLVQRALQLLRSAEYVRSVNELPGYHALHCGDVQTLRQAFPLVAAARAGR